MKKLTILSLLTLFIFVACKKDPETEPVSLKGKWQVENSVYKEYVGGALTSTFTEPGAGSTMDFQDNGHVVIKYPDNSVESMLYSIKPDSKVDIDGDVFEVRNLTASAVTLLLREDYSPGEYDEVYINLKR